MAEERNGRGFTGRAISLRALLGASLLQCLGDFDTCGVERLIFFDFRFSICMCVFPHEGGAHSFEMSWGKRSSGEDDQNDGGRGRFDLDDAWNDWNAGEFVAVLSGGNTMHTAFDLA